jgi:hypothetical protein
VNPLSDPGTAKADPKLAGVWAANMNGAEVWLHFNPRETGAVVDVLMIGHDPKDGAMVLHYEGFPSQIGGKSYLNLREKTFANMWESAYTVSTHYIFARYDFEKDGSLTLSVMDGTPATEAIRKKEIAGGVRGESELFTENTLTADSAALAAWVVKAGPGLFDKLGTFKKIDPKLVKSTGKGTK